MAERDPLGLGVARGDVEHVRPIQRSHIRSHVVGTVRWERRECQEHVMGCRRDGGGPRGARRRRQAAQIRLEPTVDGIDRVIDGPLHHRQVDHRERRRLAKARNGGTRRVADRVDCVDVPVEDRVIRLGRSHGPGRDQPDRPDNRKGRHAGKPAAGPGCGQGSVHGVPPSPQWSGAPPGVAAVRIWRPHSVWMHLGAKRFKKLAPGLPRQVQARPRPDALERRIDDTPKCLGDMGTSRSVSRL